MKNNYSLQQVNNGRSSSEVFEKLSEIYKGNTYTTAMWFQLTTSWKSLFIKEVSRKNSGIFLQNFLTKIQRQKLG